ncbi:hypothetical protein NQ314_008900 [Rhamnusium bicolor]|uniref:39S ribosomal protein L37, mitochondrial n=1 Tax=Rhamnusium bicolor TaxID=1586634 RepID=A0AAV8Y611_9CUCU|nr:hypothetical protein NQ314_008900 [Rhamnusium bicolor]
MRKTSVLLRQHIGWYFMKHWRIQGQRKPLETGAERSIKEKGFPVYKPEDILREKKCSKVEVVGHKNKPIPLNETHPNWHNQPLLSYKDNNVLLEGLKQAKILTKSIELKGDQKILFLDHMFLMLNKKKLPKIKDPERPAWNFPRSYGVSPTRVRKLIISRLLQLIESTCTNQELVKERYVFNDLFFSFPFERNGDLLQFQISGDTVITSSNPLPPITNVSTESLELPVIDPIKPTITLNKENIYEIKTIYPIKSLTNKTHPHTIFMHYDKEEVKNLFEEEVTESQIFGRSLLKSFTVGASYARQIYGDDVKLLPKPVSIQCIQSDGRFYHFGILQLNTLDLEESITKNIWFQTPMLNLFDKCCYKLGKPVLEGYNSEVIKYLYAFYNNV